MRGTSLPDSGRPPRPTANPAPGRLELVEEFVNTRDIEIGRDELTTIADLTRWLRDQGLLAAPDPEPAGEGVPTTASELREGILALLHANNSGETDAVALACLDRCDDSLDVRLRVWLGRERPLILEPDDVGVPGALGRIPTMCLSA